MMILAWLIFIPVLGGLAAWYGERFGRDLPRWIALGALVAELALLIAIWAEGSGGTWLAALDWQWIPQLGISFRLDLDGLSLVLIVLTIGLGLLAVAVAWNEITERVGFFHFNLLFTLAGVIGVFLALDLFLFFFFWELMLVPMYFIIALWGHERRFYAAIKFFIFTQGSGLLMLVAILGLVFIHWRATGVFTFDYFALLGTARHSPAGFWIMLGFFIAFAVKLSAFPFYSWLPDAYSEAPTAGSVILAGVLAKGGGYGLLRFVLPLFPVAAGQFAPVAMLLGAIGVLYGAVLAFAQHDMKRLIAYSSLSQMGFVLLGIFAGNALTIQGAVILMVAHGISTGALFIVTGLMEDRIHTRDMRGIGGLFAAVPMLSSAGVVFAIATLGLPGLGNFIGEFLVLLGSWGVNRPLTIAAAAGFVTSVIYALTLVHRTFFGVPYAAGTPPDLDRRETAVIAVLMAAILWLGVYPQPFFNTVASGLADLRHPRANILIPAAGGLSPADKLRAGGGS
jgi:NADH-quinone oxidoreductase subunit M